MWLLNTTTLKLEEFIGDRTPPYAILSHTWGEDEFTFADINAPDLPPKRSYEKIQLTCAQAKTESLQYVWIDTCCIDKSSSAELSESINSMYSYYQGAKRCYAYLADVDATEFDDTVTASRWFTRGWTLQELLAPSDVSFFNKKWDLLGTRTDNSQRLSEITKIDESALHGYRRSSWLQQFCVAQKMSWASGRNTTRLEDTAYCLLGLFGVNMPLLYGEGENAFSRLQQEIIRVVADQSILAFNIGFHEHEFVTKTGTSLARHPRDFANCHQIKRGNSRGSPCNMTSNGIEMALPLVRYSEGSFPGHGRFLAILNCSAGRNDEIVCIGLNVTKTPAVYERCQFSGHSQTPVDTSVVDFRKAAQARSKKVIIASGLPMDRFPLHYPQEKVIIGNIGGLEALGYQVSMIASQRSRVDRLTSRGWDQRAQVYEGGILTREGQYVVTFESNANRTIIHHTHFYVLMQDNVALLWRGPPPTLGKHNVFDVSYRSNWGSGKKPVTIIASDGRHFQAFPRASLVEAGQWRLHTLDVEVCHVQGEAERVACICEKPEWDPSFSSGDLCHICKGPRCWKVLPDHLLGGFGHVQQDRKRPCDLGGRIRSNL